MMRGIEFVIKFSTDDKVTSGNGRYVVITGFGKNHFLALDEYAREMKFSYDHNWKPYTEPIPQWDWSKRVQWAWFDDAGIYAILKISNTLFSVIYKDSHPFLRTKSRIIKNYTPCSRPDNYKDYELEEE